MKCKDLNMLKILAEEYAEAPGAAEKSRRMMTRTCWTHHLQWPSLQRQQEATPEYSHLCARPVGKPTGNSCNELETTTLYHPIFQRTVPRALPVATSAMKNTLLQRSQSLNTTISGQYIATVNGQQQQAPEGTPGLHAPSGKPHRHHNVRQLALPVGGSNSPPHG